MHPSFGLAKKLFLGVAVLIAGYLFSAGYSFYSGAQNEAELRQASGEHFPFAIESRSALFAFEEAAKLYNDAVLTGDDAVLAAAAQKSDAALRILESLAHRFHDSATPQTLTASQQVVTAHREQGRALFKAAASSTAATQAAVQEQAKLFAGHTDETRASLSRFVDECTARLQLSLASVAENNRHVRFATAVLCIVVIIAGGGALLLIIRGANRSLTGAAHSLDRSMLQMAGAVGQLTGASHTLAAGASQQAASLEESSASLEEISSMTKRNVEGAQQAKALSTSARLAADKGAADMEEMQRAMDAIKTSSKGISKIIKTIDEIAFQTNILALNAAVEAARAGEAGMGFAVVAEEVRNLAHRSAESAKETGAKIEEAIQKSEHGVQISCKIAGSLAEIVDKARKVDALVAEIAAASVEQNQGISQVNQAVGQMDQITQANAASAEETAAAAEELNGHSRSMRQNVGELLNLVGGNKHPDTIEKPEASAAADLNRAGTPGSSANATPSIRPARVRAPVA